MQHSKYVKRQARTLKQHINSIKNIKNVTHKEKFVKMLAACTSVNVRTMFKLISFSSIWFYNHKIFQAFKPF